MKTDSLFYFLFQTAPGILFELLGESANLAVEYEFRSIELKQTAFRLDGVLLPRTFSSQKTIYFIEIQFQQDPYFYHRFFAEIFLFLRQNSQTIYCQAVVIFANRNIEPRITPIQQTLLDSEQVQRIYLEDLEDLDSDSLSIGLVQLIAVDSKQAITQAKNLLAQAQQETSSPLTTTTIIELIETIIVYKFPKLNREEIAQMLGLSELKQTRVYQDAYQEGRQEGRQEGECHLVLRLLTRHIESIPPEIETQIQALSISQLEALGDTLLDIESISDLQAWLASTDR